LATEAIVNSRTRSFSLGLRLLLLLDWCLLLLLLLGRLRLVLDGTLVLIDLFRHFGGLGRGVVESAWLGTWKRELES